MRMELRYVDGFVCYQNRIGDGMNLGEMDLTRDIVGEHFFEDKAKEQCETYNKTLPSGEYPYYYEPGRILD